MKSWKEDKYMLKDEDVCLVGKGDGIPAINYIDETSEEYTGGSSNYYKINIDNPTTFEASYQAECNDIIEALDMSFAEGNIFKAIWRRAASRKGKKKAGHNEEYDAEKILFFAKRLNGERIE